MRTFTSTSDQFGQTELNINASGLITSVALIKNGAHRIMLDCKVDSLFGVPASLFNLRFTRLDLNTPKNNIADESNPFPFGAVEYWMSGVPLPQDLPDGSLSFVYKGVVFSKVWQPRTTNPPLPPLPGFGSIDVTLTFSRSVLPNDTGWVDLDISFTYPNAITNKSLTEAWEVTLFYPQINFDNTGSAEGVALSEHELVFPEGLLGSLKKVHEVDLENKPVNELAQLMKVQYGALFKRGKVDGINNVSGIALSGTDELGQCKALHYQRWKDTDTTQNTDTSVLQAEMKLPIHLLDDGKGNIAYVRPTAVSGQPAAFTLSEGDANGFRGAQMTFRLRAFHVDGVCKDAQVGWTDAASVYRQMVWSRQPAFLKKPARTTDGPTDRMSPFTLICNYGIDASSASPGPGAPPVDQWLEIHPAEDGHSDTGTKNTSLLAALSTTRSQMEVTQVDWAPVTADSRIVSPVAASSRQPNQIDLFARSSNNRLLFGGWDGHKWVDWTEDASSSIKDSPASVSWDPKRLDVFVRGLGDKLFHKFWANAPFSSWEDRGQPRVASPGVAAVTVASSPAVASRGPDRLDCFVRGSDGLIWHLQWEGGVWKWEKWDAPPNGADSAPAAVSWGPDRVDCLVRSGGTEKALYLRALTPAGLSNWYFLGTPPGLTFQSDPAIASWASKRLDVFGWASDNGLWRRGFNGNIWTDWVRLGTTKSAPTCVAWGIHRVDCFMLDGHSVNHKWLDQNASLEAQVWGYEAGSFYHFLGSQPTTDIISGDPKKFRRSLDALNDHGIVPIITTDPLAPLFNRVRYRGHLVGPSLDEAITVPFPDRIQNYQRDHGSVGPVTVLKVTNQPDNNRAFLVEQDPAFLPDQVRPNVMDADTLADYNERYDPGAPGPWYGALSNRFYGASMRPICTNETLKKIYLTKWAHDVLAQGARLVEFMKIRWPVLSCYNKMHPHLVLPSPSPTEYNKVMGVGSWYIQQLQDIWQKLEQMGRNADPTIPKEAYPSFALTCEGAPYEMLVPYVDEFYARSLLFQYVYSGRTSAKMPTTGVDFCVQPGYKETRSAVVMPPASQLDMMLPILDTPVPVPVPPPVPVPAPVAIPIPTFEDWKSKSELIANYYNITYGLAPVNYPTSPVDPANPNAPRTHYTYRRCVQSYFNMRADIFSLGASVVLGERIFFNSTWFEQPNEYLAEAIAFAVKAAKLQTTFREFFRDGFWRGQTAVRQGQQTIYAWYAPFRQFRDVDLLVQKLYSGVEIDGGPTVNPLKLDIRDFISRATDKDIITPLGKASYLPLETKGATQIQTDQIQHLVWQREAIFGRELLYVFANVGNTAANVEFQYAKGLESQTPTNDPWFRTLYTFSGDGRGAPTTDRVLKSVVLGDWETIAIAARSLLAVRLTR